MRYIKLVLVASLIAIVAQASSLADTITYNASDQPVLIEGLDLGTLGVFNVSITYGVSFNDFYGAGLPPSNFTPTFWNDDTGASAAVTAIAAKLNSALVPPQITTRISVPTASTTTLTDFSSAPAVVYQEPIFVPYTVVGLGNSRTFAQLNNGFTSFALVPEPGSSALLLTVGLVGLIGRRRR